MTDSGRSSGSIRISGSSPAQSEILTDGALAFLAVGTCTVDASQAADAADGYLRASAATNITVDAQSALAFDSAYPGRATFQSAGGTTYLYLFDTNSALEMSVGDNGSLASGWLEGQTQNVFSNAAIAGNYLFGQLQQLNVKANASVGEFTLGASGSIDASLTTAGDGLLTWDQAASMSYSWDATAPGTGTFLVANGAQGAASCAVVNASRFVCIPQSDPSPSVQIVEQ